MSLLVTKEGILTTIQDMGRVGFRAFGVNPNGVMDPTAARLLNELLGNPENAPVIEFHFPAGEYLFEEETDFAIGGADFSPHLSASPIESWTRTRAASGDVLRFAQKRSGNRAYLAVSGGFRTEKWLGSASTSLVTGKGGLNGCRLKTGDRVSFVPSPVWPVSHNKKIGYSILPRYSASPTVKITAGPEFDMLTGLSENVFLSEKFIVSAQSDRMGYRLTGPQLFRLSNAEILSSGTTFGTIQLLPDGQIIILTADHQTTGGYPRIATIASVDLPLVAQLGPGDRVSFELVENEHAEQLVVELERDLAFLRAGLSVESGTV